MSYLFKLKDGNVLTLPAPSPADCESYFVFGLYKGGSTLLYDIFGTINRKLGIPEIAFMKEAVAQGIRSELYNSEDAIGEVLEDRGYCYSSMRYFFPFLKSFFEKKRKAVLLIRDPRDILVSAYFSEAFSHVLMPGEIGDKQQEHREAVQQMSIDEFVVKRAPVILQRLMSYHPLLHNPGLKVYRYEEVIFSKQAWVEDMLQHLGLTLDDKVLTCIVEQHDYRPEQENPSSHVRNVSPGDHVEKLEPKTIDELNQLLDPALKLFNYVPAHRPAESKRESPVSDKVFYLHIPKCAGQSFSQALKSIMPQGTKTLGVWDLRFGADMGPETFGECDREKLLSYGLIYGHLHFPEFLHKFGEENVRENYYLITVLREPLDRAISEYSYISRFEGHDLHDYCNAHSISEFLTEKHIDNRQCDWISRTGNFEVSRDILENYFNAVGVLDGLSAVWRKVCSDLTLSTEGEFPKLNMSKAGSLPEVSEADTQLFYESNQSDLQLYEWACQQVCN